jgi:hypothetical protein
MRTACGFAVACRFLFWVEQFRTLSNGSVSNLWSNYVGAFARIAPNLFCQIGIAGNDIGKSAANGAHGYRNGFNR